MGENGGEIESGRKLNFLARRERDGFSLFTQRSQISISAHVVTRGPSLNVLGRT